VEDIITFTIEITGWTSQVQGNKLPICEIQSPIEIRNAGIDFDAYSAESLVVHTKKGQYVSSFIFWDAARAHADIGDLRLIMVNLGNKVGIVLYSKTVDFAVLTMKGSDSNVIDAFFSDDKSGIWHAFAVLEDGQKIQVKVGDA